MRCPTPWRRVARSLRTWMLGLGIALGIGAIAAACNVPVFRYALERWHPDPYRATLFHRGQLTEAQQAMVRPWEQPTGSSSANVALQVVDVDATEDEAMRTLFAAPIAHWVWLIQM